jgi:hypothetical protein
VAHRKVATVLSELGRNLGESRSLAAEAHLWATAPHAPGIPVISVKRKDSMTELAFLRAFLAWEGFLEETFVLYLMGARAPRGRAPHRFAFPPTHRAALEWVVPEGKPFAEWTHAGSVCERAERFFRDGRPFVSVLRIHLNALNEARIIRNAIAHQSKSAREKFETVVRGRLVTLPANLTVGGFLSTTMPGTTPPTSFMEFYLGKIEFSAQQIVRK